MRKRWWKTGRLEASDVWFSVFVAVSLVVLSYAVVEPHTWGHLLRHVADWAHDLLQDMARGLPRPIPM